MSLQARERPKFESSVHRRIFEFVERNGSVKPQEAADAVRIDPERFHHELTILKRDGYIDERDGMLTVSLEAGEAEEFVSDGIRYEIRPAVQADLSGILGCMRQIAEERTYLVAETVGEVLDHEGVLIRHNGASTRMFFVATVGKDVVGWAHLEAPRVEKLSHAAELTVGVLDEYRRHGIGGQLLERSINWAADQGYEKVYNSIPATNQDAARFLERHAYETEAIRRDHYKIDDDYVAELMMARRI